MAPPPTVPSATTVAPATIAPPTTAPPTTAPPATTVVPTTAPTTTAPPTTTTSGPVVVTGRRLAWSSPCGDADLDGTYGRTDAAISLTFDAQPSLSALELRTRPADALDGDRGGHGTGGFGIVHWRRYELDADDGPGHEFALPRSTPYPMAHVVDLVAGLADGTTCEARMFTEVEHAETTDEERRLTVPVDIAVDRSRYADVVLPGPTLEALVYAFASYRGWHGMGDEEPEYPMWKVWEDKTIRDYEPELRHFLFGNTQDRGDWEAAAHMLEILAVLHPDLDPLFATTVDEVNFPQFHPLCERWMLDGDLDQNRPCQRKDNSAYFSDVSTRQLGDSPGFADARGWTYHNTWVIDAKDLERPDARDEWEVGEVVQNPCCTINFHEVGHAMGLEHTYCAHSAVGRWEDRPYMTATWSTDDLAGMAVHLDPRTTHGMTIHEAADALGIAQDDRFDDMVANPWRACGRQHPGWTAFADRIYANHVSSENVETNHPDGRAPILYDR